MKKIFLLSIFIFLVFPVSIVFSQTSEGGMPPSYSIKGLRSGVIIPEFKLKSIDINQLRNADQLDGTPMQYAVVENVELDIKALGLKTSIGAGNIWQFKISSDNALSLKLMFGTFAIPQGAKLFVYNDDYSLVYGAYTSENMVADSTFAIADFSGSSLIIEYFEPTDAAFSGTLLLKQVSKAYKDLDALMTRAATTFVDVNCSGGVNWQLEKHAVCRYTFSNGSSGFLCSGALINNINNDGTPYFLTASHCINLPTEALTVVAYFNYETLGCGLGNKPFRTLSGATLLTTGSASDYSLLQLSHTPTAASQPYYAGWDLTSANTNTVCIHHPNGDLKKISFDNDPPTTNSTIINWDQGSSSPPGSHWVVIFDEGAVAPGSSGSPLFNQNKRIIGQLHGGDSEEFYGKINYSWTSPNAGFSTLKSYLEGSNTTIFSNGFYPPSNIPEAKVCTSSSTVCIGAPIQFTDCSIFNTSFWDWTFTPGSVSFLQGTNRNSKNPIVSFDAAGTYGVKFVAGNSSGKDSISVSSIVTAANKIVVASVSNPVSGTCLYKVDSIVVSGSGASQYTWQLDEASKSNFNITPLNSTQAVIKLNNNVNINSTIFAKGIEIGTQGLCVDSSSFSVELDKPANDNIAFASPIVTGTNGPFTNVCATVQTNEPKPTEVSCFSQTGWCDENFTGSTVLNNSVWFYFYAPPTGSVSIEADNMDGQIALYDADSPNDLLSGNYKLIAANDNINTDNTNSRIASAEVIPERKYWLQFDGSNKGAEGSFILKLITEPTIQEAFVLFPQPATNLLNIKGSELVGHKTVKVEIFSTLGRLLFSNDLNVSFKTVTVDLDGRWPDGVYIIQLTGDGVSLKRKFIKLTK